MNDEELRNFKAPKIDNAEFVRWFSTGDPDKLSTADVAIVYRVDSRMISVMVMTGNSRGKRFDSVRHVSDPKLKLNPEHRMDGCWDYTPEYIRRREWEAKIEGQIAALRLNIGRKNARDAKEELIHQEQ